MFRACSRMASHSRPTPARAARAARRGGSTEIASPWLHVAAGHETAITPALRIKLPSASRAEGRFHRPSGDARRAARGCAGRPPPRSRPSRGGGAPVGGEEVDAAVDSVLADIWPGETVKRPSAARRGAPRGSGAPGAGFGRLGSARTRERCCTVTPACASPSTPSPASRPNAVLVGLADGVGGVAAHRLDDGLGHAACLRRFFSPAFLNSSKRRRSARGNAAIVRVSQARLAGSAARSWWSRAARPPSRRRRPARAASGPRR